jgi:hypothetical protein
LALRWNLWFFRPVIWISKTFDSGHFCKKFRVSLALDKVCFHLHYTQLTN